MKRDPLQVGAPDPEQKNSPILAEVDDDSPSELELEVGVCYFNGTAFPLGQYVLSGAELLRCEQRGVWVREGEMRPDSGRPGK